MNKIFRHKILAGAMMFGFMLAGSSCQDEVGIKVTPETPYADKTLYEVIVGDPDLTDFVEVINACGAQCADSLFNQSRVYTVWAPVNGTFNKDSIIAETVADSTGNSNRDIVFRSFVEAHIANHLVPANGTLDEDNTVLLLNNKNAIFTGDYKTGYTFSGISLDPNNTNIRMKNGLLHKIVAPSEYKYSIWEYMKIAKGENWSVDSVTQYLYSYNVTEFNEGQSIAGPVVNGEQTFIDSVFTTTNKWLDVWRGVGNINSEDSTYIVYVPTDDLWEKMVKMAEAHYNYDLSYPDDILSPSIKFERDSLRRYYARFNNLKYMTYSVNEQKHVESSDSMMPAYRGGKRALFAKADIEKSVIFEKELSNGVFKVVDKMPYKQTDLWHDTIAVEGENNSSWYYTDASGKITEAPAEVEVLTAYKNQLNKDSMLLGAEVSGGAYFSYTKESGTATAYFKIPKVLSAKYHVAIVVVPKNITNEFIKKEDIHPSRFDIVLKQDLGKVDPLTNKTSVELYTAKYDRTADKDKSLKTDPFKMDTLFFTTNGEKAIIQPRYCEYYDGEAKDYNVTLQISSTTATTSEKRQGKYFDTAIRIDKILLIPVLDSEE